MQSGRQTYTMTLDYNNETNSTLTTKSITYGNTYGSFASPTKTGYTLNGWRVGKRLIDETTFNGSSTYINLGRTYMYTDRITVMARAYMDDWTQYKNNMRIISCTEGGGWNLEQSGEYLQFAIYDSGVGYKEAKSNISFANLGSGWHTFVATFDGEYARLNIDGRLVGTSAKFSSGKIGYHASNSILVGAEAGSSSSPVGAYFKGKISYVSIINSVSNTATSTAYPAYNTVAVACWTANQYTVTANANGGTIPTTSGWTIASGSKTATKSVTYDSTYGTLPTLTRTGFTFDGWKLNGSVITSSTKVQTASNHTLTASWTANTYTISYNGNGNTGGSTASSTHTYDVAKNLTANGFTKTGYTFAGWATSPSGNVVHADKASVKNLSATQGATITFYAKWTINSYTLSINPNGGYRVSDNSTAVITVTKNYQASENISERRKTGYTLTGYTLKNTASGSTTDIGGATFTFDNSTKTGVFKQGTVACTLVAQWTANTYTVTTNANGGTIPTTSGWTVASGSKTATKTVTYDSTYGTLPTPTRTGHTFKAWTNSPFSMSDWLMNFVNRSPGVSAGSASVDISNNSITLTSTGGDTYTSTYGNSADYKITLEQNTTYTFSWLQGSDFTPRCFVFVKPSASEAWDWTHTKEGGTKDAATGRYYITISTGTYTCAEIRFGVNGKSGSFKFYDAKIEKGSSPTAYETTSSTKVTTASNHTLYAEWIPKTITITLNKNGGTGGTTTIYYKYGINTFYSNAACTTTISKVTLPTKEYYNCTGYFGDGTSGGNNDENFIRSDGTFQGDLCTDIYKNATLTAKWSVKKYTLTVNWGSDSNGNGDWYFEVQFNGAVQVSSSQNGTQSGTRTFSIEATSSLSVYFYIQSPKGLIYHKTGRVSISGNCTNSGFGSRKADVAEGNTSLSGSASNFKENITISFYFSASK